MLKKGKALELVASGFFFIAIFVLFGSKQVSDYDFWWHLSTGQYIVQQQSLPQTDPFSLVSFLNSTRELDIFSLRSSWLSEVLFYWTFKIVGFRGIMLLKALMYSAIFFMQWIWLKREHVPLVLRYVLLVPGVYLMLFNFPGERPQIFSFVFAAGVILLLERFRKTNGRLYALPVVMVIWANMHGGYLVGLGIIFTYLVVEGISATVLQKAHEVRYKELCVWGILAIFASLVNPNTYHAMPFMSVVNSSVLSKDVIEWQSIFKLASRYHLTEPAFFAMAMTGVAVLAFFFNRKRLDLLHAVLLAEVLIGGYYMYRLFAFTVVIGLPIIGIYLGRSITTLNEGFFRWKGRRNVSVFVEGSVFILSLIIIGVFFAERMFLEDDYNRDKFPVKAADFIERNRIEGDIFNHYNYGGYLIWRLYPGHKVFIDGRANSGTAYNYHLDILGGEEGGGPLNWNALLESYGLHIILISPLDLLTGDIFPLIPTLINDGSWRLIYYDERDVIFVKDVPLFREVIRIYNMPKERAYFTVIALAEKGIAAVPDEPNNYLSMGLALRELGRNEEAEVFFQKARQLLPRLKPGMELR